MVAEGPPRTKKTSNRTVDGGRRCGRCGRGQRTFVLPSEAFENFEKLAAPQLHRAWARSWPKGTRPVEECSRCEGHTSLGGRVCLGCDGEGKRVLPWRGAVNVAAVFYRDRNVGDLAGFITSIGDVLETAGVIANDRQIAGWDGTRRDKDALRPRVEITITFLDEEPTDTAGDDHDDPQLNLPDAPRSA